MYTAITNKQKLITFSEDLYKLADEKAKKLGLAFTEYVRFLVVGDVKKNIEEREIISQEVETRVKKSLEDLKKGNYKELKSNDEIVSHFKNLK